MLPLGKNNKKIKIKKTFEGHFPGLIWHIFLGTLEASLHEWKIRAKWFWEYLRKSVELERHVLDCEIRIVILIFLNIAAFAWITNQKMFAVDFPYNYAFGEEAADVQPPIIPNDNPDLVGMTRLDSEKDDSNNDENKKEESQAIITELNKLISTQDEKCQKDKNNERCTELCVKNEEEIIAKMKEEERQAWAKYLSGKPKLLKGPSPSKNISCPKDTKGARKSPNKGKHMDEDCCPDPDEWPKPGCRYSAEGLTLMLKGPSGKK